MVPCATQRFPAMGQLRQLVDRLFVDETTDDLGVTQNVHRVFDTESRRMLGFCELNIMYKLTEDIEREKRRWLLT